MSTQTEKTTLVSLFHTEEQAKKAIDDLQDAGIPPQSVQSLGGNSRSSAPEQSLSTLKTLNLPASDLHMLSEGLKSGGTLIVVRAEEPYAQKAEDIFERHHANQVDERLAPSQTSPRATGVSEEGAATIPILEEELIVGKRRVERGGVRVFSRTVETPVEEQVMLREEHVTVERHPVDRPISEAEVDKLRDQRFEVREMGEEAVVGKTSRVVEEVHVGKEATERKQQVKDTVRKTEVEVEQLASDLSNRFQGNKK